MAELRVLAVANESVVGVTGLGVLVVVNGFGGELAASVASGLCCVVEDATEAEDEELEDENSEEVPAIVECVIAVVSFCTVAERLLDWLKEATLEEKCD